MTIRTLSDLKNEIRLLMQYAVPEEHLKKAQSIVDLYENDIIALNVFHAFYSFLPEARDDMIEELRLLNRKQKVFLICASTMFTNYIYLATNETAEYLGELAEGIWDEDVLRYFGIPDRKTFLARHGRLSDFPAYMPSAAHQDLCPVCSAASGECHTYGCPLETCPWCHGGLTKCNCRFTIMKKDSLESDAHIDAFLAILEKKGRIPFDAARDMPDYPACPGDLIDGGG